MIRRITMPDFIFANSKVKKHIEQSYNIVYADAAKIAKERLDKSQDFRGGNLKELQPVTRQVRRLRGRAGSRPLVDTGSLKNSIKLVKKKTIRRYAKDELHMLFGVAYKTVETNRIGLTFNKYGIYHAKGYKTSNSFWATNKKTNLIKLKKNTQVPARKWINPDNVGEGLTTQKRLFKAGKSFVRLYKSTLRSKGLKEYKFR